MPPFLPSATRDFSEEPSRPPRGAQSAQNSGAAGVVLALQRSHGNRRVARTVSQRLAREPAAAPTAHVPWVEQTTGENRALAKEIDELEALDMEEYRRRRDITEMRAADPSDAHWEQYKHTLDAFEFIETRRIAPMRVRRELLDETYDGGSHKIRSRNVRVVVEQGVQESGSLRKATEHMKQFKSLENDIFFIEHDAKLFGEDFERQARGFAGKMLDQSREDIIKEIRKYGLKRDSVIVARNRILQGEDREKVVREVVDADAIWDPIEDSAHRPTSTTRWRNALAAQVGRLKKQQDEVRRLRDAREKMKRHIRGEVWIPDPVAFNAAAGPIADAEKRLEVMWARAERDHKVLAAFRGGEKDLAGVDLDKLEDSSERASQMMPLIDNLIGKLLDIWTIQYRLRPGGDLSPLSLPPVVAVTKAAMFVPPGSIREGRVNDMVEDAQDKGIAKYIAEGLLALIALALVLPTGGATLPVAIAVVSVALSATSAVEDWEDYRVQKELGNTALERANALSAADPSLLWFAIDLISLGLDGVTLVKAFEGVKALRSIVRAGEESHGGDELKKLVDELNKIGADAPKHDAKLGERVLGDLKNAEHDADAAAHGSTGGGAKPPGHDPPKPPDTPTPPRGPEPPKRASKGHPKPPVKAPPPRLRPPPGSRYETEEALRRAVRADLAKLDFATPNQEWKKLLRFLRGPRHRLHGSFLQKIREAHALMRDPQAIERYMVELWLTAAREQITEEEALLRFFGGREGMPVVRNQSEEGFRQAMLGEKPVIDGTPSVVGSKHGAFVHVFHEYMLARMWGSKAAARAFIQEIAMQIQEVKGNERLYQLIWNSLFDEFNGHSAHIPENLGEILIRRLDLEGDLELKPK